MLINVNKSQCLDDLIIIDNAKIIINNDIDFNIDSDYFEIINVCTVEDNNRENYLIESIIVKNNQINIKSPVDDNI